MDYINQEHRDLFFEIPQEDAKRLNEQFNKSIEKKKKKKIKCFSVGEEIKLSNKANQLFNDLCEKFNLKDYLKERFLCFTQTVELFFSNKNVKSFLYFSNSKNSKMDLGGENPFRTFFLQMNDLYAENAEFYFLSGANETFERKKQKMFECLKEGKKVFAVTSYWSMGAGQNVHYEFNSKFDSDLVQVNSFEYAVGFKPKKYMLGCSVLNRIYRGALGEVVGRFLLTNNLFKFLDIKFETLPTNIYEKFDNKYDDIFFDFKLWSGDRNPSHEKEIGRIRKKMYECRARKVIFINILKPQKIKTKPYLDELSDPILVIPYLYDDEKNEWNKEGIQKLFEELLKH